MQKYLEDPIAEELLKGKYSEGAKIRVKVNKKTGELKFSGTHPTKSPDSKTEEEKPANVS